MFRPFVALTLVVLAMALSSAAKERSSAPAAAEQGRMVVSLDASWNFTLDPTGQAPAGEWAAVLPSPVTVTLPHSRKITGQGAAWYAREITFPGEGKVDVLLNLDHPVGTLDVFLDGTHMAHFAGNGLPQSTRLQGDGGSTHHLALRLARAGLPPSARQEPIYGLGHISMELLSPLRIDALSVVMDPQKKTLTARYHLFTPEPANAVFKLEVLTADGKRAITRDQQTLNLPATGISGEKALSVKRLKSWSPRDPGATCLLRATLLVDGKAVDTRELICGACAVTITDEGLQLNGQALQLKGIRLPGGIPMRYQPVSERKTDAGQGNEAAPTLEETIRNELALAKRAGFNAIMADGSALPEEVLAAADELGILVVGEIPLEDGVPLIRATLEACAQHPCIIAWSWAGAGNQIADLRVLDPSRPILLRDGAQSRLIGPRETEGRVVADFDLSLPVAQAEDWWDRLQQLEEGRRPVLATGLGIEMAALPNSAEGIRGNTAEGNEALGLLRGVVESLRRGRHFPLFGYFVRLPEAETLTGLSTPEGNPTNALTTSLAFNQSCAVVMRVKSAVAVDEQTILDAAIVSDAHLQGEYQLYQVVTTPADGRTAITAHELELTGKSEQYDLRKLLSFTPERAGEYRLQLVLSQDDRVIASTQVARITVSSSEIAAR